MHDLVLLLTRHGYAVLALALFLEAVGIPIPGSSAPTRSCRECQWKKWPVAEDPSRVLLVDVRSHGYYDAGAVRIQGSVRLEPNKLRTAQAELPKDKGIYLYCT